MWSVRKAIVLRTGGNRYPEPPIKKGGLSGYQTAPHTTASTNSIAVALTSQGNISRPPACHRMKPCARWRGHAVKRHLHLIDRDVVGAQLKWRIDWRPVAHFTVTL